MSRTVRFAWSLIALATAVALTLACAGAPIAPAPPPSTGESTAALPEPATAPSTSASTALSPAPSSTEAPAPAAPSSPAPATETAAPPCIGGEIMLGGCICPHGKGVDDTGHCVYAPCPKGEMGGTVFRDEATGQCMECRPGTRPSKDGKCAAH